MTEVLPDPTEAFFAQDPTILREPERTARVEGTRRSPVVPVAIGLGGAYLAYRTHMIQRLHQELQNLGPRITQHALLTLASGIWNVFIPQWISMTAPYLAQGYMIGARAARAGTVPDDVLKQIAEGYAEQLGMHINDVSAKAMASGFQAQVNRKAPPQLAARRVADAYGVPRKTMNSLVNIWESDEAKKLTDIPLPSAKEQRAKYVIETQNALRARQVGDTESWAAYTQGKQLVWMYGQQHGTIPKYARRVWITAHDERVCPVCGPMDGVAAPIGKKFPTSDGEYWTPPAHINCRCEVVLDLSPDKDADESLRALLQAEAVSKARPGDPYDRDEGGRFAASERRKVRGKPVAVKSTEPIKLQPLQLPGTDLTRTDKLQPLALNKLQPLKGLKPLELKGGTASSDKLKQAKLNSRLKDKQLVVRLDHPLLQSPTKPLKPVSTGQGEWKPRKYPLVTLVTDWGEAPVDYNDIYILMDGDQAWYEVIPGRDGFTKYSEGLNRAINDHWTAFEKQRIEDYYSDDFPVEKKTWYASDGRPYFIDDGAYIDAVIEAYNDIPPGQSDVIDLYGFGENADAKTRVKLSDIAEYMGIYEAVAENKPHLVVTWYEMPGVTQASSGTDEYSNPGKWKLVKDAAEDPSTGLTHYPYQIHEAMPEDLEG